MLIVRNRDGAIATKSRWSLIASQRRSPLVQVLGTIVVGIVVWALFALTECLATGVEFDPRPALLCLSLLGFSVISYVVWPSRWNVLAHLQLAFGVVAYIIPVLFLGGGRVVPDDVLGLYTAIMFVGFACATLGAVLGAWVAGGAASRPIIARLAIPRDRTERTIPSRVQTIGWLACLGVVVAFAVMGFIPALAADPFAAKFFRGSYAESYAPVAPLYRAATSALTVLLPLLAMYAVWRRKPLWIALFLGTLAILLLTLQREPAASGILLFIGIVVALWRRGMFVYFLGLVAIYFAGSASYFVLAAMGVGNFVAGIQITPVGFLENVAAGAPDLADQFVFLQAWLANPVYANGLTFIGGLVPGNFEWNPAVWSLAVTNPGADVTEINSGGFRLPGPLWGFVNFGWTGVVGVGLLYGALSGYLARVFSHLLARETNVFAVPSARSKETAVLTFIVYAAILDCASQFFALSYVTVVQAILILAIVYVGRVRMPWVRLGASK